MKDDCGNISADTIIVSAAAPIPFSIGPNRTKCNNDTLHLDAPPGFLNYEWKNNYNISSLSAQSVIINPAVDTTYYIKAEKTPGCFAYDTVKISVFHSGVINLGEDRSFCSADSAVFNAGGGFSQYSWSTGQLTPGIVARNIGSYSVIGTTTAGCRSYDTVKVIQVFARPVVNLNRQAFLCNGSTIVLDAGNFTRFLWNTGSTSRTITVNNIGNYYVEVTDNNGCKASDSNRITAIFPLPENFLPRDSAICTYGSITISSLNMYKTYLWNDNSAAPSITVANAGKYWLQVTDQNNCVGRDTIQIDQKNCQAGFYIPTAFTPNSDGKNDVYKPLIFGNVSQYSFTIYNRYGKVVFQTNDLQKGWDGTQAGAVQNGNAFIWVCTYQIDGTVKRMEKGTLLILR